MTPVRSLGHPGVPAAVAEDTAMPIANNAPILTRSASVFSGINPPTIMTRAAAPRVNRTGVPVRWLTLATTGGSRRSRSIAKPIRPMPTRSTRTWANKATHTNGYVYSDYQRYDGYWTCANGTGNQLYRVITYGYAKA